MAAASALAGWLSVSAYSLTRSVKARGGCYRAAAGRGAAWHVGSSDACRVPVHTDFAYVMAMLYLCNWPLPY